LWDRARRPIPNPADRFSAVSGVDEGSRTPDFQDHNLIQGRENAPKSPERAVQTHTEPHPGCRSAPGVHPPTGGGSAPRSTSSCGALLGAAPHGTENWTEAGTRLGESFPPDAVWLVGFLAWRAGGPGLPEVGRSGGATSGR